MMNFDLSVRRDGWFHTGGSILDLGKGRLGQLYADGAAFLLREVEIDSGSPKFPMCGMNPAATNSA